MSWSAAPERGAALPLRVMVFLLRHAGGLARGLVLPGITAWFTLTSPRARRASREFLALVLDRPVRLRDTVRHIHVFAATIADRVALLTGTGVETEVDGLEHVAVLARSGRGGVLLGAHLGSFPVLQQLAQHSPVPVRAVMFRENAGALTRVLDALAPAGASAVIPIGGVHSLLPVHQAVAAGELVGLLADRAPAGARTVRVPFLGRPASFPAGPFALAAALGVPVLTVSAVRTGPSRYRIRFAPFADPVLLPRQNRDAVLAAVVARFAAWLEAECRAHPFNWFNFFAFWDSPHDPIPARPAGSSDAARHPLLRPADSAAG